MTVPTLDHPITSVKQGLPDDSQHHTTNQGHQDAQAVLRLYERLGSWDAVADALGYSAAFWWKVSGGKIKGPLSKELRRSLSSSDPKLLRLILQGAVPWLKKGEASSF